MTAYASKPCLMLDGPMETRIKFNSSLQVDDEISIFTLVSKPEGRETLTKFYSEDVSIAKQFNLPVILNAPTFRANPAHCERLGFKAEDIKRINTECVNFVEGIRSGFADFKNNIFIMGPIGPRLAGYKPDYAFDLAFMTRFYCLQADALAETNVDIISTVAMPSLVEALGSAITIANTGRPYSVGLIMTREGRLLDGTPFELAIDKIDNSTKIAPVFYVVSCTHPSIAEEALSKINSRLNRIKGIKANGTKLPLKELIQLEHPKVDEPSVFADEVVSLGQKYHLKIYGCCCGTDSRHIKALAARLKEGSKEA